MSCRPRRLCVPLPDNITATVDATHAKPGSGVKLDVTVGSTIRGVTVQQPARIVLDIDTFQTKELQMQVNARAGPGWSIIKSTALCPSSPCVIHFSGPAGWEKNMTASVAYPNLVQAGSGDSLNQPIQIQNSNGVVDMSCHTQPCVSLDTLAASVHVEAVAGSTSSTVALLDAPPSHGPANGYRITAVTIGNPHCVSIMNKISRALVEKLGPALKSVKTYVAMTDREHMPANGQMGGLLCYEGLLAAVVPVCGQWDTFRSAGLRR